MGEGDSKDDSGEGLDCLERALDKIGSLGVLTWVVGRREEMRRVAREGREGKMECSKREEESCGIL